MSRSHVFIKTLNGRTILLDTGPSKTIGSIKKQIEYKEHIPIDEQRLVLSGKQYDDTYTLSESLLLTEPTLHLSLRLIGGAGVTMIQPSDLTFSFVYYNTVPDPPQYDSVVTISWTDTNSAVATVYYSWVLYEYVDTVQSAVINYATGDGNSITFTTTTAHGLSAGQVVLITNVTPSGFNVGPVTITGVPNSVQFLVSGSQAGNYSGQSGIITVRSPTQVASNASTLSQTNHNTSAITSVTSRIGKQFYFTCRATSPGNTSSAIITSSTTVAPGFIITSYTYNATNPMSLTVNFQSYATDGSNPNGIYELDYYPTVGDVTWIKIKDSGAYPTTRSYTFNASSTDAAGSTLQNFFSGSLTNTVRIKGTINGVDYYSNSSNLTSVDDGSTSGTLIMMPAITGFTITKPSAYELTNTITINQTALTGAVYWYINGQQVGFTTSASSANTVSLTINSSAYPVYFSQQLTCNHTVAMINTIYNITVSTNFQRPISATDVNFGQSSPTEITYINTAGYTSVILPPVASYVGKVLHFKCTFATASGTAFRIVPYCPGYIQGNSSVLIPLALNSVLDATIDGLDSITLTTSMYCVSIVSNGINWFIVNSYTPPYPTYYGSPPTFGGNEISFTFGDATQSSNKTTETTNNQVIFLNHTATIGTGYRYVVLWPTTPTVNFIKHIVIRNTTAQAIFIALPAHCYLEGVSPEHGGANTWSSFIAPPSYSCFTLSYTVAGGFFVMGYVNYGNLTGISSYPGSTTPITKKLTLTSQTSQNYALSSVFPNTNAATVQIVKYSNFTSQANVIAVPNGSSSMIVGTDTNKKGLQMTTGLYKCAWIATYYNGSSYTSLPILYYYSIPDPPSSVSVTSTVTGQASISFTDPTNVAEGTIINYNYSTDGGITFASTGSITSPITVTTLSSDGVTTFTSGIVYYFCLQTVTTKGVSIPSPNNSAYVSIV